jgi:hypothetical protein
LSTKGPPAPVAPPPLRAVYTPNVPALLPHQDASLFATTDQAGTLVMIRDELFIVRTLFNVAVLPGAPEGQLP